MMVYPRSENRFFVIKLRDDRRLARECQGADMPEATVYGRHLVLKTVQSSIDKNADFDASRVPTGGSGDPPCRSGPRERIFGSL